MYHFQSVEGLKNPALGSTVIISFQLRNCITWQSRQSVPVLYLMYLQSWRAPLVALHEDRHQFCDEKAPVLQCDGYKRDLWVEACQIREIRVSQHVVRDLIVEIARAANYDGPSLSIGPSDNSLARMNVRNGSHGTPSRPAKFWNFGIFGFSPGQHTHVTASNPYSVWVGRSSEKRLLAALKEPRKDLQLGHITW